MMMVKHLHEIRLRDVILLDATKSADTLKKYWFIPIWLCRKELEKLAKQIFDAIGGQTVNAIEDDFDKLLSYRKIQLLEALYKAVQIEIGLKPRINAWRVILEKDYKESPQLETVLSEVKRFTDIDIQSPDDVITLRDYVQHAIDKHLEMFPAKAEEREVSSLSKVIYSVFNYMSEPYNENMRLITFVELKQIAEDRAKQSKTKEDGINE